MFEKLNPFLDKYSFESIRYFLIVALMSLVAFSIAFGYKYGQRILLVTLIIWVFTVKKEDFKHLNNTPFIIFGLIIISHIISLFWSQNIQSGANYIASIVKYIVIPMLIILTIIKKEHLTYILTAFIFGMFINEIISYLIYFDLYETAYSKIHRYPVGFINHIAYSVLVAFTAILILNQIRTLENKYLKIVYIIFFITMTTNLVISSGRTGYVVFFGSLLVLLFTYYKVTWKNLLQIILFPAIVFYISYKLNEDVQKRIEATIKAVDNVSNNSNYDTSFGARLGFYPMSLEILSQEHNSFIFGIGAGDIIHEIKESNTRIKMFGTQHRHTHNSFLDTYVLTGVFGLIIFIMFFVYLWKQYIKDKEIKLIQQLFLISITISMFGDHLFRNKQIMIFIAIFASIILIYSRYEKKEQGLKNEV